MVVVATLFLGCGSHVTTVDLTQFLGCNKLVSRLEQPCQQGCNNLANKVATTLPIRLQQLTLATCQYSVTLKVIMPE